MTRNELGQVSWINQGNSIDDFCSIAHAAPTKRRAHRGRQRISESCAIPELIYITLSLYWLLRLRCLVRLLVRRLPLLGVGPLPRSMPYEEASGYLHYRSRDGNLALVRYNSWRRSGDIPVSAGELALHKQRLSFDDLFYSEIREVS